MSDALRRRRELASTPPSAVLTQPSFWIRQGRFLLTLAAGGAIVAALSPYTYDGDGSWELVLTIGVQLLALWGVAISARALAVLEVETALAAEIEAGASTYLVAIKAGQRGKIDLDRLEQTLAPTNTANPPPAMIRLLQHVCKEAKDRRFDSALNLMQPYREEALDSIFRLQNVQKVALWAGILGTFVGMLIALQSGIARVGESNDLVAMVNSMFAGLFISFKASIAGIEVAILVTFMLLVVRTRQQVYFARMESAVVAMLSAARHAINPDEFLTEFTQVTAIVRDLTDRVSEQTRELIEVRRSVEGQNVAIGAGLTKLAEGRSDLDTFLKDTRTTQSDFIAEVRGVYDALSFKTLAPAIEEGVTRAGADIAQRMVQTHTETAAQLEQMNQAVQAFTATLKSQSEQFERVVSSAITSFTTLSGENARALQAATTRLQNDAVKQKMSDDGVAVQVRSLASAIDGLKTAIGHRSYGEPNRRSFWQTLTSSVRSGSSSVRDRRS